jgi:hypothetical protein
MDEGMLTGERVVAVPANRIEGSIAVFSKLAKLRLHELHGGTWTDDVVDIERRRGVGNLEGTI